MANKDTIPPRFVVDVINGLHARCAYLEAQLDERDKRIAALVSKVAAAHQRIAELER